jgi:hypothetical protein
VKLGRRSCRDKHFVIGSGREQCVRRLVGKLHKRTRFIVDDKRSRLSEANRARQRVVCRDTQLITRRSEELVEEEKSAIRQQLMVSLRKALALIFEKLALLHAIEVVLVAVLAVFAALAQTAQPVLAQHLSFINVSKWTSVAFEALTSLKEHAYFVLCARNFRREVIA